MRLVGWWCLWCFRTSGCVVSTCLIWFRAGVCGVYGVLDSSHWFLSCFFNCFLIGFPLVFSIRVFH